MKRSEFDLKHLCMPSFLYFSVSFVILLILAFSNINDKSLLCVGNYHCNVGNNLVIFLINAIYILFWTFILDLLCKNGWNDLSWFIFLLPFILSFLLYVLLFIKF